MTSLYLLVLILAGCYAAMPPRIQFPSPELELESRVNDVERRQAIAEQRQTAITQSFSNEMTTLFKDTAAIKTTVTRLVEDSVSIMGRLRILQDVGDDVVNLRKQVNNMQKDAKDKESQMQNKINAVTSKLDQLASASTYITVGLSTQMKQNKDIMKGLENTIAQMDNKIKMTESKLESLESAAKNPAVENLQGKVDELNETLLGLQSTKDQDIANMKAEIQKLKDLLQRK